MDALEQYYQEYLLDYAQDSNWGNYDVDMQLTRDTIERILERGYIDDQDATFVRSILPDIENNRIRLDMEDYLDALCITDPEK